jgi:hypothetical protein
MGANKDYSRKRGHLLEKGTKLRTISFSFSKLDNTQGQTLKEWENLGLLAELCIRTQQISQYSVEECLRLQFVKQYTKVTFPPKSKFKEPTHVTPPNWAVIHIKPNSKEVAVGYLEDDVFHFVFLDKEHDFWDTDIQERGKNRK